MKTKSFRGVALAVAAVMGCAGAALGAVAQSPLMTGSSAVPPNLMFTLDDSGSMYFECLPDALCVSGGNRVGTIPGGMTGAGGLKSGVASYGSVFGARMRTAAINPLYYNPGTRYQPWLQADNTRKAQYPGTAAPVDPRNPGGTTINLAVAASMSLSWCDATNNCAVSARTIYPAQYFNLNTGASGNALTDFTQVLIQSGGVYPKAAARTDCAGATACSFAEELQNFSNWYTYARSRMLVAIGGTSEAFSEVASDYRVGYGTINTLNQLVDDFTTNTVARGVRPFSGGDRGDFYTRLQSAEPNGGTPLRRAMNDVGQYFSRVDKKGPWSDTPGKLSARADLSCRRSFHLLMTDGVWNGDGASTVEATADVDSTSGPLITSPDGQSFQYSPTKPYAGDGGNTLADIAMYYWNHDLHGGLDNGVAASAANPAFWQHMVNYTIAFGVNGNLANPGDLPALTAGSKTWGTPVADAGAVNVDDLWHAAVNSRGKSLSATNSLEYAAAVRSMLDDIAARSSSEAGVAVSGLAGTAATRKYVPAYSTDKWSGELSAVKLVDGSTAWKASTMLPAPASRNIYTFADATVKGVAFKKADLDTAGMTSLLGVTDPTGLIAFLRGDRTGEGTTYRTRATSVLGDIVNSTPVFVLNTADGQYDFLSSSTPGQGDYRKFLSSKKYRAGQVFAGANDGMLHAFSDANGAETFAFMPRAVLGKVKKLAESPYAHQYFVDGPLVETDVYDTVANKWRNLVAGGGGGGAKNLFAVNVPVPAWSATPVALTVAQSTPGASDILWEVSDSTTGFAELGHVLQKPVFGILRDGTWVMLVGNGYDSASKKAQLFVVNAVTGALIKVIDTGAGSATTPNGLGGITVVLDGQQRIVSAYGGDLLGNMWKFDFASPTQSAWGVAFGGYPLFKAWNTAAQTEPFTAAPAYLNHPLGGVMLLAGTGKMFESTDMSDTQERTLYGVWDKVAIGAASGDTSTVLATNASLVTQTTTSTPIAGTVGGTYYQVSSNAVDYGTGAAGGGKRGWRLPMSNQSGQRLIYAPWLTVGRVVFDSLAPGDSGASCSINNGKTYRYVLDPMTGSPSSSGPTFDTNGNLVIDSGDSTTAGVVQGEIGGPAVGVQPGGNPSNTSLVDANAKPVLVQGDKNTVGRNWRQIINPPAL